MADLDRPTQPVKKQQYKSIRFDRSEFKTEIVGEQTYQKNIKEAILYEVMVEKDDLEYKDEKLIATIVLEDDNKFDPGNAVRIDIDNKTVGYLDKQTAKQYRRQLERLSLIEASCSCNAAVYGKRNEDSGVMTFGVWLFIDLKDLSYKVSNDNASQPKKKTNPLIVILILAVFGALFFCAVINNNSDDEEISLSPEESAWTACELFVQKQLGIDILEAQRYTPSGVKIVQENFYQVEIYYANQNSFYRCGLQRHNNGDWQLLSLEVK